MANRARGYASVNIGAEQFDLAFGLGVLAEIEGEFGVESFEEALDFGDKISATKLRKFMRALLKGNEIDLTVERLRSIDMMTPAEFMETLTAVTSASPLQRQDNTEPKAKEPTVPFRGRKGGRRG